LVQESCEKQRLGMEFLITVLQCGTLKWCGPILRNNENDCTKIYTDIMNMMWIVCNLEVSER